MNIFFELGHQMFFNSDISCIAWSQPTEHRVKQQWKKRIFFETTMNALICQKWTVMRDDKKQHDSCLIWAHRLDQMRGRHWLVESSWRSVWTWVISIMADSENCQLQSQSFKGWEWRNTYHEKWSYVKRKKLEALHESARDRDRQKTESLWFLCWMSARFCHA